MCIMENLDNRLVGKWRRTETHSDANYAFSFVTDFHMNILSDGTIELSTRSMGGTDTIMGDSNTNTIYGFWYTVNDGFYTSDTGNEPWTFVGDYVVDNERMMFRQPQGNKLWERQY